MSKATALLAKKQFNLIQLFALEVHKIFDSTSYRQLIGS
jgi:hypothetical protein